MNRDSHEQQQKRSRRAVTDASEQTKRALQAATVLGIDEVSMISLGTLDEIDRRLRALRGVDEIFGGLSIVVSGDLLQQPPIGGRPLWDTTSTDAATVRGRELWHSFSSVVFLHSNMRCLDARYAALLERARYGIWLDEDIALINTRLLGAGLRLETHDHVATIVHTNASRSEINRYAIGRAAAQLAMGAIVCVKGDIAATRNGRAPTVAELELLHDIDDSKDSNSLSPTLHLYVGQRVSITENVATALGVANGAQGIIVGFKFADGGAVATTELADVNVNGVSRRVTLCTTMPELVLVSLVGQFS